MGDDHVMLVALNCHACGEPFISSPICDHPGLCHSCFGDWLANGNGEVR